MQKPRRAGGAVNTLTPQPDHECLLSDQQACDARARGALKAQSTSYLCVTICQVWADSLLSVFRFGFVCLFVVYCYFSSRRLDFERFCVQRA